MYKSLPQKLLKLASSILLVCAGTLGWATVGWAQSSSVSGKITDKADGTPLPGVNILVKGTTNGTISNVDGQYNLSIQSDNPVLVFSSIGYLTQEVPVGNQQEISIQMNEDVASLDEVVVIGYGTQKKSNITGAIASVSGEELEKVQVASFDQAIQGRAAGVYVTSNSGQPGGRHQRTHSGHWLYQQQQPAVCSRWSHRRCRE